MKTVTAHTPLSTTIGALSCTVNDINHDLNTNNPITLLINDPVPAVVTIAGDASPSYTWSARNNYPLMVGSQAASTVLTFPQAGVATVTCTILDNTATDSPASVVITFNIVDAL